jgi:effector-binding domain-containing protein
MVYDVRVEKATSRPLAAVRAEVAPADVSRAFRAPLDQVWAFLRSHPGVHAGGHNVFLYHHEMRDGRMPVDFGVEVTGAFPAAGDVRFVATPAGEVAVVVHRGPYDRLKEAHDALRRWFTAEERRIGAASWEIYGDWSEDPAKLETAICYLIG